MSAPRLAATVLWLREGEGGLEVLLQRRDARSRFMPDVYVYPGGALDEADHALAADASRVVGAPEDAHDAALRVAGLRESFEEAGLLLSEAPIGADLALWHKDRQQVQHDARAFGALLTRLSARLPLDQLTPFARWITPAIEPRRFDATFYLALAPADQRADHEAGELVDTRWMTPAQALAADAEAAITLSPPTLATLMELDALASIERAFAAARARPMCVNVPHAIEREGQLVMLLPDHPDYPWDDPHCAMATRGLGYREAHLREGRWSLR